MCRCRSGRGCLPSSAFPTRLWPRAGRGCAARLPVALGLMAATGAVAHDAIEAYCVLGELALDGSIAAIAGALPAAIGANALGKGLICPRASGAEAAWGRDRHDDPGAVQ